MPWSRTTSGGEPLTHSPPLDFQDSCYFLLSGSLLSRGAQRRGRDQRLSPRQGENTSAPKPASISAPLGPGSPYTSKPVKPDALRSLGTSSITTGPVRCA